MQEKIKECFARVRDNFEYTSDQENYGKREDWRSHLNEIDDEWKDDCDGFAITCSLLLLEEGIPADAIRIIYCKVEQSAGGGGHLVCGVDTEDDTLILDNRQKWVYSAAELDYTWISGMRASEPSVWRTI